jgi:hypothetical protein
MIQIQRLSFAHDINRMPHLIEIHTRISTTEHTLQQITNNELTVITQSGLNRNRIRGLPAKTLPHSTAASKNPSVESHQRSCTQARLV